MSPRWDQPVTVGSNTYTVASTKDKIFCYRLVKAFLDLKNILETEQDLKENEDYITAQQVLKDAESQLPESAL